MHIFLLAATLLTCQQWINEIDKYATGHYLAQGQWVNITFKHPIEHGAYLGVGELIYVNHFRRADFLKAHPEVKSVKISRSYPI